MPGPRPDATAMAAAVRDGTTTAEELVVAAFERACGRRIAKTFAPRRAGDVAASYADPSLAERTLGWRARRDIDIICADAWRWQLNGGRYTR